MTIEKFIDKWEIWWMDLPADQRGEKRDQMREDLKQFRKKSFPVDKRVKPANNVKWHNCKHCGAYTNKPDDDCYKKP